MSIIQPNIPKSIKDAISILSHDRIRSTVKLAIQGYIEQFMSLDGSLRKEFEKIGGTSLSFVTDKHFEIIPDRHPDPRFKFVQLARFYTETKEKLPAILLVDTSINYIPSQVGKTTSKREATETGYIDYHAFQANVPLTLSVGTLDEQSCDFLTSALVLMFSIFKDNYASVLQPSSENYEASWRITFPQTFASSSPSRMAMGDDPKDQIWQSTMDFEFLYEDTITLKYDVEPDTHIIGNTFNTPALEIVFPDKIVMGSKEKIILKNAPVDAAIILNNYKIAILSDGCIVLPRKLGTFNINVINLHNETIKSKTVEIVLTI